jgi:prepilin signal peptidase PulO-like enzyme (type II secretory pathway)
MGDSKMISAYGLGFTTVESMFIWLYLAYFLGSLHGIWLKLSAKPTRIPFGMSIYAAWLAIYMGEYAHVAMDYSR